jgi:probable HAF family extracellular repeat protein
MKRTISKVVLLSVVVALLMGAQPVSGQSDDTQRYSITDLGTLGGSSSIALGINSCGQVVGEAETDTGAPHAFLWEDDRMIDLGTLSGANQSSTASGINSRGQIVGRSDTDTDPETGEGHAVLWSK